MNNICWPRDNECGAQKFFLAAHLQQWTQLWDDNTAISQYEQALTNLQDEWLRVKYLCVVVLLANCFFKQ